MSCLLTQHDEFPMNMNFLAAILKDVSGTILQSSATSRLYSPEFVEGRFSEVQLQNRA
jgi:hypothetical protein